MSERLTVYKYVVPDRLADLEAATIRFTQPGALNDPVEMRPYFDAVVTQDALERRLRDQYPESVRRSYELLPAAVKERMDVDQYMSYMLSPERRLADRMEQQLRIRAEYISQQLQGVLDKQIGIVSLTEEPSSPIMWAHYAAGHTGLVYGFDRTHTFFTDGDGSAKLNRVIYSEEKPRATLWDMANHEIFLTKSTHWSYEREWRVFARLDQLEDTGKVDPLGYPVLVGEFPMGALKYVVLGCRATSETRSRLLALLATRPEYAHVFVFRAEVGLRHFALSLRRIAV